MKFQVNKKAAVIATAIGTLLVSNVATYKTAYSGGYRTSITESRVGYMPIPEASGAIIVSEVNGKPHHYFEPYPAQPTFSTRTPWNSKENREYLEYSIKNNMERTLFNGTKVKVQVASAACASQTTANFWDCTYRELGQNGNQNMRVEVNPQTGDWRSN
jgi:hypothetical protein